MIYHGSINTDINCSVLYQLKLQSCLQRQPQAECITVATSCSFNSAEQHSQVIWIKMAWKASGPNDVGKKKKGFPTFPTCFSINRAEPASHPSSLLNLPMKNLTYQKIQAVHCRTAALMTRISYLIQFYQVFPQPFDHSYQSLFKCKENCFYILFWYLITFN